MPQQEEESKSSLPSLQEHLPQLGSRAAASGFDELDLEPSEDEKKLLESKRIEITQLAAKKREEELDMFGSGKEEEKLERINKGLASLKLVPNKEDIERLANEKRMQNNKQIRDALVTGDEGLKKVKKVKKEGEEKTGLEKLKGG